MKKMYSYVLAISLAFLTGCSTENTAPENDQFPEINFFITEKDTSGQINPKSETDICTEINLIAGQNYDAGSVIVTEDESYLYITYTTEGNWRIDATHMYTGICGDIPQTRSGNPKVGVFDYGTEHAEGVTEVVYAIEKEFFDECFCVAAHAEVSLTDDAGNVIQQETAWGEGPTFDGNSWAMYHEFCQSGCTGGDDEDDDGDGLGDGPVQK